MKPLEAREYAELLEAVADNAIRRLEEVRLPLHILLENRFGELNENQEEMLGAARVAAEGIDAEFVALRRIAGLDLGRRTGMIERVRVSALVDAVLPLLHASAQSAGATVRVEVAPLLPAVVVSRVEMQEALLMVLRPLLEGARPGTELDFVVRGEAGVTLKLSGVSQQAPTIQSILGARLIAVNGGCFEDQHSMVRITLPVAT